MHIQVVPAQAISPKLAETWAELQRVDASLHSPFFRPEFVQHVAEVQPGVEVAVMSEGDEPVGFFPFQRNGGNCGGPVGGPLSDFQGVVARADLSWDAATLVRGCRLAAWHFHHVLVDQAPLAPYCYLEAPSYYMDLSGGFEAYQAERAAAGSQQIRKTRQKMRKVERELGPLRFVGHTSDPQVFDTLLAWKTDAYRRIGAIDYLAPAWTRELLTQLVRSTDPALSGMLSAVYFGDRLAAVHLGLRSFETLHAWYPTYDPALEAYSPGLIYFVALAEHAAELGIERIDLGRGSERFKESLGSAAVTVGEGSVDRRLLAGRMRHGAFHLVRWLQHSRLKTPARMAARMVPGLRRWATFH